MIESIIIATMICGLVAIVLGVIIGISSKILYVAPDVRIQQIFEMLPHFNCGACGTPGCEALAGELIAGNKKVSDCKPCKPERREEIAVKLDELLHPE